MFELRKANVLDDPNLQPYLTLRRPLDHREKRIFVAEGEKLVRRLLQSHFEVVSVLLTPEWLDNFQPLLASRKENIIVYLAEKTMVEQLTGFTFYQGLLAVGKIPDPLPLEKILSQQARPYLLVALDEISNAENLGVIVRNCAAFGVHALLVGETSSSPFLRRAVRSSMGAIFRLPVVELASLAETLYALRRENIWCCAAHPHTDYTTLARAQLAGDCCIVLGNEAYGISQKVLAACDEAAAIPMQSGVDSLNVSNASAVFLYEANRQRRKIDLRT